MPGKKNIDINKIKVQAAAGDADACFKAGDYYLKEGDIGQAIDYFQKGGEHVSCWVGLADCYFTHEDYSTAIQWYQEAAKKKYYLAQLRLGEIYEKGKCGVPPSLQIALQYYEELALQQDKKSIRICRKYKMTEKIAALKKSEKPQVANASSQFPQHTDSKHSLYDKFKGAFSMQRIPTTQALSNQTVTGVAVLLPPPDGKVIAKDIFEKLTELQTADKFNKPVEKAKLKQIENELADLLSQVPVETFNEWKSNQVLDVTVKRGSQSSLSERLLHMARYCPDFLKHIRQTRGVAYDVTDGFYGNTILHRLYDINSFEIATQALDILLDGNNDNYQPRVLTKLNINTPNKDKRTVFGEYIVKHAYLLAERLLDKRRNLIDSKVELPGILEEEKREKSSTDDKEVASSSEYLKKSEGYLALVRMHARLDPAYETESKKIIATYTMKRIGCLIKEYNSRLAEQKKIVDIIRRKTEIELERDGHDTVNNAVRDKPEADRKLTAMEADLNKELRNLDLSVVRQSTEMNNSFIAMRKALPEEVAKKWGAVFSKNEVKLSIKSALRFIVKFYTKELQRELKLKAFFQYDVEQKLREKKQQADNLSKELEGCVQELRQTRRTDTELRTKMGDGDRTDEQEAALSKSQSAIDALVTKRKKLDKSFKDAEQENKQLVEDVKALELHNKVFRRNLKYKQILLRGLRLQIRALAFKETEVIVGKETRSSLEKSYKELCSEIAGWNQKEAMSAFPKWEDGGSSVASLTPVIDKMKQYVERAIRIEEERVKIDAALNNKVKTEKEQFKSVVAFWYSAAKIKSTVNSASKTQPAVTSAVTARRSSLFDPSEFAHVKAATAPVKEISKVDCKDQKKERVKTYGSEKLGNYLRAWRAKSAIAADSKETLVFPDEKHKKELINSHLINFLETEAKKLGYVSETAKLPNAADVKTPVSVASPKGSPNNAASSAAFFPAAPTSLVAEAKVTASAVNSAAANAGPK